MKPSYYAKFNNSVNKDEWEDFQYGIGESSGI